MLGAVSGGKTCWQALQIGTQRRKAERPPAATRPSGLK